MSWKDSAFNKWAAYGFMLLILFVLQSTVLDVIAICGVRPNLLLCALCGVAMFEGEWAGAIFGLCFGFLSDTIFGSVQGFFMMFGTILGAVTGLLCKVYVRRSLANTCVVCGALSLVFNSLIFFTHFFGYSEASIGTTYVTRVFPEMAYTMVAMIPFFFLCRKINQMVTVEEE